MTECNVGGNCGMSKCALGGCIATPPTGPATRYGEDDLEGAKSAPQARKDDSEKPRLDLIPTAPLVGIGNVLGFGAKKYAAHNWRAGFAYSRLIGAALRHVTSFNDGEDLDPESKLSHIDHALCTLMFLREQIAKGTGTDDRYKPGA